MPRLTLGLALGVALVLGATACSNDTTRAEGLEARLHAVLDASAHSQAPVRLDDVTGFDWDRFHSFPPHTARDTIDRVLGFQWNGAARFDLGERGDIALLVFVKGGEVTASLGYPRDQGDFAGIEPSRAFTPQTAVFVATRTPDLPGAESRLLVEPANGDD